MVFIKKIVIFRLVSHGQTVMSLPLKSTEICIKQTLSGGENDWSEYIKNSCQYLLNFVCESILFTTSELLKKII